MTYASIYAIIFDMIIVLDTNVLYQALRSNKGASHYILQLIREQKVTLVLSMQVFNEYEDVLKRPDKLKDLGLSTLDIEKVLRFISYIAEPVTTYFLFRPNLQDEKDNIFVELAVAGNAEYLITSNTRDFILNKELKFDNINIVTPSEFVSIWRKKHED